MLSDKKKMPQSGQRVGENHLPGQITTFDIWDDGQNCHHHHGQPENLGNLQNNVRNANFLAIRNFLKSRKIPLKGQFLLTSHPFFILLFFCSGLLFDLPWH